MLTYLRPNGVSLLLGIAAAIPLLMSCGSDEGLTAPTEGAVEVTTTTSGADLDTDGYTVSVDGSTPRAIGINATMTLPDIEPGERPVILAGVAPNCTVGFGLSQRIATVPVGDTVKVAFSVACESSEPPPEPGGGEPVP
jgi:hypothetical protein